MSAKHMLSKSMCKPHYARALFVLCTALWYTQHFATAKINKYLQIFINHFKLLIEHLINTNCSLHIFAWLGFRGALLLAFSTVVSVWLCHVSMLTWQYYWFSPWGYTSLYCVMLPVFCLAGRVASCVGLMQSLVLLPLSLWFLIGRGGKLLYHHSIECWSDCNVKQSGDHPWMDTMTSCTHT